MTTRIPLVGNPYMREALMASLKRYTTRGIHMRKTISLGLSEVVSRPFQIAHVLVTGALVRSIIERFTSHPMLFTVEQANVNVSHFSDLSNWTMEDFKSLNSTKDKELVLQALFPAILENTLAHSDTPLKYENRVHLISSEQSCEVCLTQNKAEFGVSLPGSSERFHFNGKCFECCRNREVSSLCQFMEKGNNFWLFNTQSRAISLVNAASSAYATMLAAEHTTETLHRVRVMGGHSSSVAIYPRSESCKESSDKATASLSFEETQYFNALALMGSG